MYARTADGASLFVGTRAPLPVGTKRPFVFRLADGGVVLEGDGEVVEAAAAHEPGEAAGMRVALSALDEQARQVHEHIVAEARKTRAQPPPLPRATATGTAVPAVAPDERPRKAQAVAAEIRQEPPSRATIPAGAAVPPVAMATTMTVVEAAMPAPEPEPAPDSQVVEADLPEARAAFRMRGGHWIFAAGAVTALLAGAIGIATGYSLRGRAVPAAVPAPPTPQAAATPPPAPPAAPVDPPVAIVKAAPSHAPCVASVKSSPPRVPIYWNDRALGTTPLQDVAVPCGHAVVVFSRPRYERVTKTVSVDEASPARLFARLDRPPAELVLLSTPPGATFKVDEQVVGASPAHATARAYEKVAVEATKPGFDSWRQEVYVRGRATTVRAALKPGASPRWSKRQDLMP
jgi:PEGA domain-containing protein